MALGGIALIGAPALGMNYNHPFTSQARFYFTTTPIIPGVSGLVIEVPVKLNASVKAGDVLFRIDPEPFENAVKAKEASLADALQATRQLQAVADTAQKQYQSALAVRDGAKDVFERSKKLQATGVISQAQFEKAKNDYLATRGQRPRGQQAPSDPASLAVRKPTSSGSTPSRPPPSPTRYCQINLEQTVVRAPTDGTILQMFLRRRHVSRHPILRDR